MNAVDIYVRLLKGYEIGLNEGCYLYAVIWDWGIEALLAENPELKQISNSELKKRLRLPKEKIFEIQSNDEPDFSERYLLKTGQEYG